MIICNSPAKEKQRRGRWDRGGKESAQMGKGGILSGAMGL